MGPSPPRKPGSAPTSRPVGEVTMSGCLLANVCAEADPATDGDQPSKLPTLSPNAQEGGRNIIAIATKTTIATVISVLMKTFATRKTLTFTCQAHVQNTSGSAKMSSNATTGTGQEHSAQNQTNLLTT